MKKTIVIFVILTFAFVSCNEYGISPDNILNDIDLVYKTTNNITGEVFYDYVKVTILSQTPDYGLFNVTVIRDSVVIESFDIKYSNDNVWYHKYKYRIFPNDCYCPYFTSWFPIKKNLSMWTFKDTIHGDEYPSLIRDLNNPSNVLIENSNTIHELNFIGTKTHSEFYLAGKTFDSEISRLSGQQLYKIITPNNIQFPINTNYEYADNNRTIIINHFNYEIWFINDFVIAKYHEQKTSLGFAFIDRTSELVQYNIIF